MVIDYDVALYVGQLQTQFHALILFIMLICLLSTFDIDVLVPVRFSPASYFVTEGVNTVAVITLEALANHTNSFTVVVATQNGTALSECQ